MTAALATGGRVIVLTESKGLQDQIVKDFGGVGLFDMRGLSNYTCRALAKGGHLEALWSKFWGEPSCKTGPCMAGVRCDLKDSGCDYFDTVRAARKAQLVSTNYAYWIAINKYSDGLGAFNWLILDECHAADSQLSSALSVEFTAKDIKELKSKPPKPTEPLQSWRMWARVQLDRVRGKIEFFSKGAQLGTVAEGAAMFVTDTDIPDASELKTWKDLEGKCSTLSEASNDWVIQQEEHSDTVRIAPVWVRQYAESHLFLGIKRVVMMSATVRPKIKDLLDIQDENAEFYEYPSTFPPERRPIIWVPTVALRHGSEPNDLRTWCVRIDQLLQRRLDRKGIIHTVSYERQRYLIENSRFSHLMMANTPGNTRAVVQSFRDASAPAILVSPSVGTGFDFPFDLARYQIIGKVPFRDARGEILKVQSQEDPHYLSYLTAQDLIQMYGRPNRDPKDFSETIIVDDNIEWFLRQYAGCSYDKPKGKFRLEHFRSGQDCFFPEYFLEAFERVDGVPDPPALEAVAHA
jgi:Rad3-related DNA helicase